MSRHAISALRQSLRPELDAIGPQEGVRPVLDPVVTFRALVPGALHDPGAGAVAAHHVR